ncbi:MAG: glycosyltransferase [Candidatus Borkfalkiaceae bacterium]|nr:glycosyltransferase [Christensenellaceae bacterium]
MSTVAILLSTYNGEKFLREQIDSFLYQRGAEVHIYARDDGSSDNTLNILAEYKAKYDNFDFNAEKNVGVGNAFMQMVYFVPKIYDYYAFADQDDVWEEDKISEAIEFLQFRNARLYTSNQENVDAELKPLGMRYNSEKDVNLTVESILTENKLAGCTMVFTAEFCNMLADEKHRPTEDLLRNRIHDVWLASVAALTDGLIYDNRSFIKYRQHGNNVVGAFKEPLNKRIKQKFKKLKNKKLRCGRSMLAGELSERFPEYVSAHPLVQVCASVKSRGGKKRVLQNGKELRKYSGENRLSFFIKVIMGWF